MNREYFQRVYEIAKEYVPKYNLDTSTKRSGSMLAKGLVGLVLLFPGCESDDNDDDVSATTNEAQEVRQEAPRTETVTTKTSATTTTTIPSQSSSGGGSSGGGSGQDSGNPF